MLGKVFPETYTEKGELYSNGSLHRSTELSGALLFEHAFDITNNKSCSIH